MQQICVQETIKKSLLYMQKRMAMILHSKNTIKYEIIVITPAGKEALLIIFVT